jgi:hypothetical protein
VTSNYICVCVVPKGGLDPITVAIVEEAGAGHAAHRRQPILGVVAQVVSATDVPPHHVAVAVVAVGAAPGCDHCVWFAQRALRTIAALRAVGPGRGVEVTDGVVGVALAVLPLPAAAAADVGAQQPVQRGHPPAHVVAPGRIARAATPPLGVSC